MSSILVVSLSDTQDILWAMLALKILLLSISTSWSILVMVEIGNSREALVPISDQSLEYKMTSDGAISSCNVHPL